MRKTWRFVRWWHFWIITRFSSKWPDFYSLILGGSEKSTLGVKYSDQPILGRKQHRWANQIKVLFLFPSFWADEGKPTTVSLCKIYRPHRCIPSLRRNAKPRRQKAPWARKHLWNWCFFRKTDRKFTCFLLLGIFGSKKKTMKCQFCGFLFTHRNFKDSHQHPWYLLYIEQEFPVLTAS